MKPWDVPGLFHYSQALGLFESKGHLAKRSRKCATGTKLACSWGVSPSTIWKKSSLLS